MSFILDALKKSELERQRQSIPGLVDSATARSKAHLPPWAIALGVLLGVNLLVLALVLSRGTKVTEAQPTPESPDRSISAPEAARFSPLDAPPLYAPEVALPAAPPPRPAVMARTAPQGTSGPRAIRRRDPLLMADDYKAQDDEALPTINELSLSGAQALPELHLDVHVFATRPAERFVYVNMRKYHEGAALQEGPVVELIRRDGVILDYQGLRFLLPRQ